MNIGIKNEAAQVISGNICFEFSVQCFCNALPFFTDKEEYGMKFSPCMYINGKVPYLI
jgi:hypothetical protein